MLEHLSLSRLYDLDYLRWIEKNLEYLRQKQYDKVDWENLLEEIEDMGKNEKRALESNLIVLLLHLLKWQYRPEKRKGSWESSILEHRRRVRKSLQESPGLQPYIVAIFDGCYLEAVKQARAETGLPRDTFPVRCPYELATILEDEFLP